MKSDVLFPILTLSLLCLVMAGALAMANSLTAPIIELAAAERIGPVKMAILPLPEGESFVPLDLEGLPPTISAAYSATDDSGYIFISSIRAYGPTPITVICGITPDRELISSDVLSHSETVGLGTRVFTTADDDFRRGVDTIAGSTITFDAYRQLLNDSFAAFDMLRGS
jgi:Na+-translocating ferredoxin:NAD+ oxidoreductase RnfG subunit